VRRVVDAAAKKGVTIEVTAFDESTHTASQAARAVRAELGQIVKSLVFVIPRQDDDLEPVLSHDLLRGEAIALPIALAVLFAVLGLSLAVLVPFVFAACTITATLAVVLGLAHGITMVSYVSNLVELIGLGLAVDYSLLVVYRFREELGASRDVDGAIVRTMETAGRSVLFSGATVAIGLALLLFVPVPFIRSLGIGGFLVPLASMLATATLQPALLSVLGARGMRRIELLRVARNIDHGFWSRLARAIMRRPVRFLLVGVAILVAAAIPAAFLKVTPGSIAALPPVNDSVRGILLLRDRVGGRRAHPHRDRHRHRPGRRGAHAGVQARARATHERDVP